MSLWSSVVCAFLLLSITVSAQRERRRSIAGWVEADSAILPYITIRVVDSRSGVVVRTGNLDVTNTFSFAGLPDTVKEVQVLVECFDSPFRLNTADSVLVLPLDGSKPLHFKVVVENTTRGPSNSVVSWEADRCGIALATLFSMVGMWITRHSLISFIDTFLFKLPKAKRILVKR
ncbi:unnamed protein product [Phytomonas sp. Hart1]|nr:unnamed protein product [Phytomonas sp. Hart1]|eukprot:CCW67995.1 unnamed protein product [Phytomonas sp. isolate Hart1]